jgi:16S rRNA A1518/A1519 N6-dimethyltransferase RsmA/KsgA/DIM1 with predicted DNA glycosylase/AP lyase activity
MEMVEKNMEGRQIWQSQNFLRRPEFVASLIERTNITPNDLVLEIGPGK